MFVSCSCYFLLLLLVIYCNCSSTNDSCNYIIHPEDRERDIICLNFFKIALFNETRLSVSYTWGGERYTDDFYWNGSQTVLNVSEPMSKCFENPTSVKLYWSSEPISLMLDTGDTNCPTIETVYEALYWSEVCHDQRWIESSLDNGSIIFPSKTVLYPCSVTCTWKLKLKEKRGGAIALRLRKLISEPTEDYIEVHSTGTDQRTCRMTGSTNNEIEKNGIYLGQFGNDVLIKFFSDKTLNSEGFQIDYEWEEISAPSMSEDCGSVDTFNCTCTASKTINVPLKQVSQSWWKEIPESVAYFNLTAQTNESSISCPICIPITVSTTNIIPKTTFMPSNTTAANTATTITPTTSPAATIVSVKTTAAEATTTTATTPAATTTVMTTQSSIFSTSSEKTTRYLSSTLESTSSVFFTSTSTSTYKPDSNLANIKDNITIDNVAEKLSDLTNILNGINDRLTPQNVTDAVDALSAAANISGISTQAGTSFDVAVDVVLQKGNESFTSSSSEVLLDAVKQYGQNVNLSVGESSDFYNGSSFVNVVTVVNCSHREFQVGLVDNNGTSASPVLNTMSAEDKKIWVKTEGLIAIAPGVVCTNVSKATRVSFQLYRTTNIFLPNLTKNADPSGDSYCRASTKSGDLAVSATVLDRHDLESEPQMLVNIGFRRTGNPEEKKFSRNFRVDCAHWDADWKLSNQTKLIEVVGDNYLFEVDHLTDFTLLVSNFPQDPIFCEPGLSMLGTVGSSLSFIGLATVAASLLAIQLLALSSHPIVILCLFFNSSFAIFFLCFVLFSDQLTLQLSDSACTAFAAIMYYLLLSTMIWTCCRAALVYKRYVIVFDTGEQSGIFTFNRVAAFISIALPFLVVLIVSLSDESFFQRSDFFCWINPSYSDYAVIIPISLMLIGSIIVLILVVRSVFFLGRQHVTHVYRPKGSVKKDFRRRIWVVFVIQISLGLPWIFLYMTKIPGTSVFHYLFTITNAFQGVWISALHFYERRKDILKLFRRFPRLKLSWKRPNHSIVTLDSPLDSPMTTPQTTLKTVAQSKFAKSVKPQKPGHNDLYVDVLSRRIPTTKASQRK